MNIEDARILCMSQKCATEDMPFGDDYVCFRVMNKIFGGLPLNMPNTLVLKCDKEEFDEICANHSSIEQAWHWHKKHWIQIDLTGSDISKEYIKELVEKAYATVVKKLTKKEREELAQL